MERHQFGFQKQCFTITQLIDYYSDWSSAINDGSSVDVIYLDYAKAFDSVVHSKSFLKLEALGITGNLLSWIKCSCPIVIIMRVLTVQIPKFSLFSVASRRRPSLGQHFLSST